MTTLLLLLVLSVVASIGLLFGCIWGVAMHLRKRADENKRSSNAQGRE